MSNIKFLDIYKCFGKRKILTGVKLNLSSGHCSLLTGANGAGKSTLLRICAGLEKPDKGKLDIGLGRQSWKHQRHVLHCITVYLHQQPYMFDGNVMQNLAYALPQGMGKDESKQRIDDALYWAELEEIAKNSAKTLSGGERQRIAIARAWLRQPGIMLLDEPTANMDQDARQRTLQLLRSLKEQGIALLVASHDPAHFYTLADEWLVLDQGHLTNKGVYEPTADNIVSIRPSQRASS
jgi:tungstate transport system ATP-binding protein